VGRRCIEAGCPNEGTHKVLTLDGQIFHVCDKHLDIWIKSGCTTPEPVKVKLKRTFLRYGVVSTFYFIGLLLTSYGIFLLLNNEEVANAGITLVVPSEYWTGIVFIILSWIISMVTLKLALSKKI